MFADYNAMGSKFDIDKSSNRAIVILTSATTLFGAIYELTNFAVASRITEEISRLYNYGAVVVGIFIVLTVAYGSYSLPRSQRRRKLIVASSIFATGVAMLIGLLLMLSSYVHTTDSNCGTYHVVVSSHQLPDVVAGSLRDRGSWASTLCYDFDIVSGPLDDANGAVETLLITLMLGMTASLTLALVMLIWAIVIDRDKPAATPPARPAKRPAA